MSKQFILAYCVDNSNIAKEIEQNLSSADYTFEHASCPAEGDFMGEVLATKSRKIILLISDNFLRSVACMKNSLNWFQTLSTNGRLLPVVIDGRQLENGAWKNIPTSFEKVSNVIKYMNFWQEEYLELRKNKRNVSGDETQYNDHLKDVRTISSEVGEFLRHIRSAKHLTYNQFSRNHYEELFQWNDDLSWHKSFLKSPSALTPISEQIIATELPKSAAPIRMERPVAPIIETPTLPIIEALPTTSIRTEPIISASKITSEINNPVELAKPEPIEMSKVEEIADMSIDELFEENLEEIVVKTPPIELIGDFEKIIVENDIPVLSQLSNVEEVDQSSFDSLVEEIVAEEKANTADEGVSLGDFEKEMFGEETIDGITETVSVDEISEENLFAVGKDKGAEQKSIELSNTEKHKAIEEILTNSRAALKQGNVPDALNMLKGGTDEYPEEVNLRYYYAYVLANSANNQKAAKLELNTVLKQTPQHADANYLTAEIAELEEDFLAAKRHYARVIAVDKKYPNAYYRLASILAKRFSGQEEMAVNYFKTAAKQDKSNVDALFQTASLYELKLKNYEKAEKYYHKTLKLDAENVDVLMGLARISRAKENSETALDYYKKAVEIDSNLATHANQRLFAPAFVLQKMKVEEVAVPTITAKAPFLSAKDMRLQELEADIAKLQEKLSEVEQELDEQRVSKSIHNINGNGNDTTNTFLGTNTEILPNTEKKTGKVVFITGATSGIGRATSEVFAKNGYRVIITGRRWERLEELKSKYVSDYQADVKILSYDVCNPLSVKEAIQSLEDDWRNVDILINNAGLAKGFSPIQEGDMRHWEQMIDTNIKGLLYMTRAVAPQMVERRGGHIINVCSTAGHEVYPNGNVYCATKHAVDALTKSMRIDLHKHNVRVSQVSPGHVEETEFALVRFDGDADRAKIYNDFRPLTASDVAETIYFMASRPAHVNIQDILLMGTQQASSNHVDRSGR